MRDDIDVMDLSLRTKTERDIQTRFCMAGSDLITKSDIEYLLFVAGNRQFLSDRIEALETKNKEQKRIADQLLIAANIWQDRTEALEAQLERIVGRLALANERVRQLNTETDEAHEALEKKLSDTDFRYKMALHVSGFTENQIDEFILEEQSHS
jgi:hypothetical protein